MNKFKFYLHNRKYHIKKDGDIWVDPAGYTRTCFYLEWMAIGELPITKKTKWRTEMGIRFTYDEIYTRKVDLMKQFPDRFYRVCQANVPKGTLQKINYPL